MRFIPWRVEEGSNKPFKKGKRRRKEVKPGEIRKLASANVCCIHIPADVKIIPLLVLMVAIVIDLRFRSPEPIPPDEIMDGKSQVTGWFGTNQPGEEFLVYLCGGFPEFGAIPANFRCFCSSHATWLSCQGDNARDGTEYLGD